jgi:hypothetical protein
MSIITRFAELPIPPITYHSNMEYRNMIRKIFDFSKDSVTYYADLSEKDMENEIDAESRDEMEFDTAKMEEGMKQIFDVTIKNPRFNELYLLAAGRMFSTNPEIGQAVLCSYDTFHLYYSCLWHFFTKPQPSDALECKNFKTLFSHFSK